MRRTIVTLFSVAIVAITIWPVTTSPPRDSFPLSNYPMFAGARPAEASFDTVVEISADGSTRRLSPRTIGGTDQVIQAAATVARAVRDGDADELCDEIAAGIDSGTSIEVVTETYDTVAWFQGDEEPRRRTVHATCGGRS